MQTDLVDYIDWYFIRFPRSIFEKHLAASLIQEFLQKNRPLDAQDHKGITALGYSIGTNRIAVAPWQNLAHRRFFAVANWGVLINDPPLWMDYNGKSYESMDDLEVAHNSGNLQIAIVA